MVNVPAAPVGVQLYVQFARPGAGCQVVPPSVETSTAATVPPVSVAVPVIVVWVPACTVPPETGEVMVELGGVVSVDFEAGTKPDCNVVGWTPMSANRLMVACCMLKLAVVVVPS